MAAGDPAPPKDSAPVNVPQPKNGCNFYGSKVADLKITATCTYPGLANYTLVCDSNPGLAPPNPPDNTHPSWSWLYSKADIQAPNSLAFTLEILGLPTPAGSDAQVNVKVEQGGNVLRASLGGNPEPNPVVLASIPANSLSRFSFTVSLT
jgi:hypothetical protein